MELYSTSSQLCMAHTRGRLGCTKSSVRHTTAREEQKCQELKLKREHGDVMGNAWCQHMRKKQSGKKGKPCGHCTERSIGTPECYSSAGSAYLRQELGLSFRKDATLDNVFNCTSLLCTNSAEGHILPSNRWSTDILCQCLKICFRESSQSH